MQMSVYMSIYANIYMRFRSLLYWYLAKVEGTFSPPHHYFHHTLLTHRLCLGTSGNVADALLHKLHDSVIRKGPKVGMYGHVRTYFVFVFVFVHACFIYIYIYIYKWTNVCACVYVCVCIYVLARCINTVFSAREYVHVCKSYPYLALLAATDLGPAAEAAQIGQLSVKHPVRPTQSVSPCRL